VVYDRRNGLDKVIRASADEERTSYKPAPEIKTAFEMAALRSPEHEAARTEIFLTP
jgi:hypothetical protein